MTLKDIAGMAGVSIATVSYVLNHKDNKVSPEVAQRVRNIMKEVNYQPNTVAKALRSSKSKIIGILTEDLSVWQVGKIVQGVTHYAQARGYSVVLSDLGLKAKIQSRYDDIYQYQDEIDEAILALKRIRVDGIIFVGMHDRNVDGLIQTELPVVYAYSTVGQNGAVQVGYDNRRISEYVTGLLLKKHGNSVGIIDGPMQSAPARLRMSGVEDAYAKAGLLMNLQLRSNGNWEYESGMQACEKLLKAQQPVKAIYAFNDLMALGAVHKLQQMGLKVPADVEVIGFDDTQMAQYCNPPLTSIYVPLDEIGRQSAAELILWLEEGKKGKGQISLECKLMERESCRLTDTL